MKQEKYALALRRRTVLALSSSRGGAWKWRSPGNRKFRVFTLAECRGIFYFLTFSFKNMKEQENGNMLQIMSIVLEWRRIITLFFQVTAIETGFQEVSLWKIF
jgi:hypothetical protein